MSIVQRVLDSDIITWSETFAPLYVLKFFLKLGDTGYHDHKKEGVIEANINNAICKESFSILAAGTPKNPISKQDHTILHINYYRFCAWHGWSLHQVTYIPWRQLRRQQHCHFDQ